MKQKFRDTLATFGQRMKLAAYGTTGALVATPAFAAFDVTEITAAKTDVQNICTAVFAIVVVLAIARWAQRAV